MRKLFSIFLPREKRWKENITFSGDGNTVHFIQKKNFTFVPERSNGTEDDLITMLNVPLLVSKVFAIDLFETMRSARCTTISHIIAHHFSRSFSIP
jgi:hypothetical protein